MDCLCWSFCVSEIVQFFFYINRDVTKGVTFNRVSSNCNIHIISRVITDIDLLHKHVLSNMYYLSSRCMYVLGVGLLTHQR